MQIQPYFKLSILPLLAVMFILQNLVYDMILRTTGNLFLNVVAMNYVMDVRSSAMDVVAAR